MLTVSAALVVVFVIVRMVLGGRFSRRRARMQTRSLRGENAAVLFAAAQLVQLLVDLASGQWGSGALVVQLAGPLTAAGVLLLIAFAVGVRWAATCFTVIGVVAAASATFLQAGYVGVLALVVALACVLWVVGLVRGVTPSRRR